MRTIFYVFYAFKPLQFVLRTALSSRFHPFGYSSSRLGTVRRHDTPRPGPKMRTFIAHLRAINNVPYSVCTSKTPRRWRFFINDGRTPNCSVYLFSPVQYVFIYFSIVWYCTVVRTSRVRPSLFVVRKRKRWEHTK